jgi:hypothetical protein
MMEENDPRRIVTRDVTGETHEFHPDLPIGSLAGSASEHIARILSRLTFEYRNERDLQIAIYGALTGVGMASEREYRLSAQDRIDFYLEFFHVGIEVKVGGNVSTLIRQLTRYAQSEEIDALVVVTNRAKHASEMPLTLNDKPVTVVRTSWL